MFPWASFAATTRSPAVPAIGDAGRPLTAKLAAAIVIPVAVKVASTPAARALVTRTLCVPGRAPMVHRAEARPAASVRTESAERVPPPAATANRTHTPGTSAPSLAFSSTTSGAGSNEPMVALCLSPEMTVIDEGRRLTVTNPVSAGPVRSRATTRAGPRCAPPSTLPTDARGTVARAGSSELHAIGVPGTGRLFS